MMYTSLLWMALVGAAAPVDGASPEWLTDYGQAQRQAKAQDRPLAVFLAPGKDGWQKLVRNGKLNGQTLSELAASYVCVHLDTSTEYGQKWAKAFEMSDGVGVVLSDRAGEVQAFRHDGSLDENTLAKAVERHSGKAVSRTSYYPAPPTAVPGTVIYPYTQGRIEPNGFSPRFNRSSYCPT